MILIIELARTLANQKTVIRVVARGVSLLWKVIVTAIIFEYAVNNSIHILLSNL